MPRNVMNYVRTLGSSYDAKETWYYLVDQRYFIGYDKLSRRSAGIS